MKTVWKFPLPMTDRFMLDLPQGAQILSVQSQRDQLCLWALVDPGRIKETRVFRIAGTGHPIEEADRLSFVATCQVAGGSLVWHLFEYVLREGE